MKRFASALLLACALCGAGAPAWAHRFHAGLADIAFNPQSGSVEVVHTYMAHDLDALLAAQAGRAVDMTRSEDEALLRKYIEERFYLLDKDKARLPLQWVGITVGVDSVIIYRELPATPLSRIAQVHDAVLMDVMPRQANTVNITRGGVTESLSFDSTTQERRLK
ncbi:DUF6702 family protein [Massilia sp. TWP1-3-3]|uniref:DUF6702 family protein n=1 Tax=Massilia sp. TWP1-3-3 TaxID=2804573 RepID=UPI003CF6CEC6